MEELRSAVAGGPTPYLCTEPVLSQDGTQLPSSPNPLIRVHIHSPSLYV